MKNLTPKNKQRYICNKKTLPHFTTEIITIYKAFLRPLIDYGDIIYDQPQNETFCEKLESVQYEAALAITSAVQKTSRNKIYQELGLESLNSTRRHKRLSCVFEIWRGKLQII